jgi:hypothetical protein
VLHLEQLLAGVVDGEGVLAAAAAVFALPHQKCAPGEAAGTDQLFRLAPLDLPGVPPFIYN